MMKQISTSLFILFISAIPLLAQVPATLSYQGLLTDANGNPVANGTHSVTFNFYTSSSGGTAAFSRGPLSVTTFQGLFTVILGNGGTGNAALPNLGSTQYYVGLRFDTGTSDLTPLVALTAVPYAFTASALDANAVVPGAQVGTGIKAANITGTLPIGVIPSTVGVPIGTVVSYAGNTVPTNYILCDGSAVSRTTYSALFTAIGTTWGSGDGSTTFNLPDLRGLFLRGKDGGTGNDPDAASRTAKFTSGAYGNNVGSYQGDKMADHTHGQTTSDNSVNWSYAGGSGLDYGRGVSAVIANNYLQTSTQNQTGSETRPRNAYVNFIIKAQ
jgi:microcystin-dependent protein